MPKKLAPNISPREGTLSTLNLHICLAIAITISSILFVADASIHGLARNRRQIPASSSGTVNATGNQTSMSAANALWKVPDGTVGANGTSLGTAGGPGPSGVLAGSNATVGKQSANGGDSVRSQGTQSQSSGSSSSMLNGPQTGQMGSAAGSALGTGNTRIDAIGMGQLSNENKTAALRTLGVGGATGNQMAATNSSVGQMMTWSSIFAKVSGVSMSKGENNSQANVNQRAGNNNGTDIAVDALVSGVNDKPGGSSFSLASGDGTLANNTAAMNSALVGAVNTTNGGSKLVGASSLEGNGTKNGSTINTFGDLKLNGTGAGTGGLLSNSSTNPDGTSKAGVAIQGTESGANKSINVNDGIRAIDGGAPPVASIGRGSLEGSGNMAANGTSYALSGYETGKGPAQIIGTQGESMAANNTGSSLKINNMGNVLTGNKTTTNATSNANGTVNGQKSSVAGSSVLDLGRQGQAGNSSIVAQGGGAGPSNAMTNAGLALNGPNNTMRTSDINGKVNANGDQSYVQSISNVSDRNGQQSLFNSQNATVQSAGQAQATAQNSAILKRRRRRHGRILTTMAAAEAKL